MAITQVERDAIEQLAECAKIARVLNLSPAVELSQDQADPEAEYEMACQAEAIGRGLDY